MKGLYVKPMAFEERFIANEYVAACYELKCVTAYQPKPSGVNMSWTTESGASIRDNHTGSCTEAASQRIETDDKGVIVAIQENSSDQGWISGKLDGWKDVNGDGKCNSGDIIWWHTIDGGCTRQWNHWGYAQGDGSGNHS